jgi:hypothetical protein
MFNIRYSKVQGFNCLLPYSFTSPCLFVFSVPPWLKKIKGLAALSSLRSVEEFHVSGLPSVSSLRSVLVSGSFRCSIFDIQRFKVQLPAAFKVQYSIFDVRCSKVQGFGPWNLDLGFWNLVFPKSPCRPSPCRPS